jgi:hypothetical protein
MDTFALAVAAFFTLATILIVAEVEEPNFPIYLEGFE